MTGKTTGAAKATMRRRAKSEMQIRKITGKDNTLIKRYILGIRNAADKKKAVACAKHLKGREALGFFENGKLNGWLSYDNLLIYEWFSESQSYEPLVEIIMKSLGLGVPVEDVIAKVNSTLDSIEFADDVSSGDAGAEEAPEEAVHPDSPAFAEEGGAPEEEAHVGDDYLSQFADADLEYEKEDEDDAVENETEILDESAESSPSQPEVAAPQIEIPGNAGQVTDTPEAIVFPSPSATAGDNTAPSQLGMPPVQDFMPYDPPQTPAYFDDSPSFAPLTADYEPMIPSNGSYGQPTSLYQDDDDYDPFLDDMQPARSPYPFPDDMLQTQPAASFSNPVSQSPMGYYSQMGQQDPFSQPMQPPSQQPINLGELQQIGIQQPDPFQMDAPQTGYQPAELNPYQSEPLIPNDFEQSPFFNQGAPDFTMPGANPASPYQQGYDSIPGDAVPEDKGNRKKKSFFQKVTRRRR